MIFFLYPNCLLPHFFNFLQDPLQSNCPRLTPQDDVRLEPTPRPPCTQASDWSLDLVQIPLDPVCRSLDQAPLHRGSIGALQGLSTDSVSSDVGSDGSIFTLNLKIWKGQKLRSIILLHIGQVTFNFPFLKIPNVFIFMISGHEPHNYSCLWMHQITQNSSREIPNHFRNITPGNLKISKVGNFGRDVLRKMRMWKLKLW